MQFSLEIHSNSYNAPKILKISKSDIPDKIDTFHFFIEFSIPWIWKWIPQVERDEDNIPTLMRVSYTKFWEKMAHKNPATKEINCLDTINKINQKIDDYKKLYQKKQQQKQSPMIDISQISQQLKTQEGPTSKEKLIEQYLQDMKKKLMEDLIEDARSDTSMASSSKGNNFEDIINFQDAQDPNDVIIEDNFDQIMEHLKEDKCKNKNKQKK